MARNDHKICLVFIINGVDISIEVNLDAPLIEAVQRVLEESNNTGRPPEEWEVRNVDGVLLEMNRTPKELILQEGARLFLSLRVGAGGIDQD